LVTDVESSSFFSSSQLSSDLSSLQLKPSVVAFGSSELLLTLPDLGQLTRHVEHTSVLIFVLFLPLLPLVARTRQMVSEEAGFVAFFPTFSVSVTGNL
jgi:hypothetical protein